MTNLLFISGILFIVDAVVCSNGDIISLIKGLSAKIDGINAKLEQKTKDDAVIYQNLQLIREFKYERRRVTWIQAKEECIKWGGNLLTINSKKENDYFLRSMKGMLNVVWIGLNDIHEEGHFVWVSGKQSSFNHWYKGEPNGGHSENCVEMFVDLNGTWNDRCCDCVEKNGFACERYRPR